MQGPQRPEKRRVRDHFGLLGGHWHGRGKALPTPPAGGHPPKQAAAAVGQCELMYTYDKAFTEYNHTVAQILLTAADVDHPDRFENFRNTMHRLLELKALPIINENDTVVTDELVIGDNDTLAARVAVSMEADLLVLLSDIDGLYTADPHTHPEATLISEIPDLTQEILSWPAARARPWVPGDVHQAPRGGHLHRRRLRYDYRQRVHPLHPLRHCGRQARGQPLPRKERITAMNFQPPFDPTACYPPPVFSGGEFPGGGPDPAELTLTRGLLEEALAAKPALAALSAEEKKAVLLSMADALEADADAILAANAQDLEGAKDTIAPVMQDRLRLTQGRIADMAAGVRAVAELPDPVGRTLSTHVLPNGLQVCKTSVPPGGHRHHLRVPAQCNLRRRQPDLPGGGASVCCGGARSPSTPTPPLWPPCTRPWPSTTCPPPW